MMLSKADAEAYVDWINSFENISHQCTHITDLSDGIILFEVLADIDPKWFKLIRSADVGDNWVLKINNLKKLHKLVSRYYEEVLGRQCENLPPVNLGAIAKDADVKETVQLCQLVICIAVQCSKNQVYINKIQNLSQQAQHALMLSIEDVIKTTSGAGGDQDSSASDSNYRAGSTGGGASSSSTSGAMGGRSRPTSSYGQEAMLRNPAELGRILEEKQDLEMQHKKIIEEHAQLRYRYDELESEKMDLQLRLRDMDRAVEQANETGRADFVMRTEIEHLKQDLQRSEDRRQELELAYEREIIKVEDLTRRNDDYAKRVEQASRLSDQLDEYRHAAEKLQKAENVIEKYKKKLEESADYRRQIKAMEEQNHSLMERNTHIEEEYRKVLAFKTLMDSYKEQVANLETANKTLIRDKNKMEYELQHMSKKVEILEADRARDMDRIQVLEENLQEVQLGGTIDPVMTRQEVGGDPDDMDLDDGGITDSLEESLKESNVTELRLSNRRLQRENKSLKEENASGHQVVVLKHLLEDANRLKGQFEKQYLEVSQERDILQSDMARIRENVPDALMDQSQHTLSYRLHIIDLEKESKSLREANAKLESKIAEGKFAFGDNAEEFKQVSQRTQQLEEQTKMQLQDINKLLLEKDYLQSQSIEQKDLLLEKERLNSEMKASLAAYEAKDDEPIKQQNAQLQAQAIHLQEQMRELKTKYRKAKDFIMQQDKMIKDSKNGIPSGDGNNDEAMAALQTELRLRDEENDKLRKQLHEVRLQTRREQQLIISAWYDVARRTQKQLVNSKVAPYPNSWLGQQRGVLDSQLKRR